MTITEFLLARLAEDDAAARDALEQGSDPDPDGWLAIGWPKCEHPGPVVLIAPERFLAEVQAKRTIVQRCSDYDGDSLLGEHILRDLATAYADHPDYDEAWQP